MKIETFNPMTDFIVDRYDPYAVKLVKFLSTDTTQEALSQVHVYRYENGVIRCNVISSKGNPAQTMELDLKQAHALYDLLTIILERGLQNGEQTK